MMRDREVLTMRLFACAAFFLLQLCSSVIANEFCNGIEPGAIMISGFNMDNPDEVLMVVLEPVASGGTFYMTDRPWDGSAFLDLENDGTHMVCLRLMHCLIRRTMSLTVSFIDSFVAYCVRGSGKSMHLFLETPNFVVAVL